MRIIAGISKGTKLETIEGFETRPTTDRVKESIFNIVNMEIYDSRVLDLFSGSGSIGIEAASRKAKKVILVENNIKCKEIIKKNVEKSKLTDIIDIVIKDVDRAIRGFEEKFDLIFMDPPYGKGLVGKTINEIMESDILADGGIIIAEHSKEDFVPDDVINLKVEKQKKYGKICITIYRRYIND